MTQDHKAISSKGGLPVSVHDTVHLGVCESRRAIELLDLCMYFTVYAVCTEIAKGDKRRALCTSAPVSSPYPGLEMHGPSSLAWVASHWGSFQSLTQTQRKSCSHISLTEVR